MKKYRLPLLIILTLILGASAVRLYQMQKSAPGANTNSMTNTSRENTTVVMQTSQGAITLELFKNDAPKTVENFLQLARAGFYDDTKFHRVIKGFMIQGGDPFTKDNTQKTRWGTGGPGYAFADEINSHQLVRGILAMANSGPDTNGSQFFIVTAPATPWLDGKHTAFGRVVSGMEVVDTIEAVGTEGPDRPVEAVVMQGITLQ